jgi:hypothetical protein
MFSCKLRKHAQDVPDLICSQTRRKRSPAAFCDHRNPETAVLKRKLLSENQMRLIAKAIEGDWRGHREESGARGCSRRGELDTGHTGSGKAAWRRGRKDHQHWLNHKHSDASHDGRLHGDQRRGGRRDARAGQGARAETNSRELDQPRGLWSRRVLTPPEAFPTSVLRGADSSDMERTAGPCDPLY